MELVDEDDLLMPSGGQGGCDGKMTTYTRG